jgi:hypothetical protein
MLGYRLEGSGIRPVRMNVDDLVKHSLGYNESST